MVKIVRRSDVEVDVPIATLKQQLRELLESFAEMRVTLIKRPDGKREIIITEV